MTVFSEHRVPRSSFLVFGAPHIDEESIDEVIACLRSGWIGTGPRVQQFESLVGALVQSPHPVAVSSCTAALHLALVAAGIGKGDEVITTAMTFCATVNAIVHAGATPVLVDCDPETMLIDPAAIERSITSRTKAIIPVHLAGRVCDMDPISAIAARHSLLVIEDAAHALEASYRGRKIGSISPITCFSFYATKNLTTAEGGLVAANDEALASRIRSLSLHGLSADAWARYAGSSFRHYTVEEPGFKYNMTDLQAALGIRQIAKLQPWLARREEIWRRYDHALQMLPLTLPASVPSDMLHARHLYTIRIRHDDCGISRDEFCERMRSLRIGTGIHYIGAHLHPYYQRTYQCRAEDFPNATAVSEETVSLPLTPHLTDSDVDDVIEAVHTALGGG